MSLVIGGVDCDNFVINGVEMDKVVVNGNVVFEAFKVWNTFSPGSSTVSGNFRTPVVKLHSVNQSAAGVPNADQSHDVAQLLFSIATTANPDGSAATGTMFIQFRGQPSMTTAASKFLNDNLAGLIFRVYATSNPSKFVDVPVRQLILPETRFSVAGIDAVRLNFTAHSDTDKETYALGGMVRSGDNMRRAFPTGTPISIKVLYKE